jgi:hypothetical protein
MRIPVFEWVGVCITLGSDRRYIAANGCSGGNCGHAVVRSTHAGAACQPCCGQKKPHSRAGLFQSVKCRLDNLNFLGLHAFLATGGDERDLLAFFQAFEAVALNGFEVYEQVVTGLRGDEAEAFFIVEPLDGASLTIGHGVSPETDLITARKNPDFGAECKHVKGVVAMIGSKSNIR